MAFYRLYTLNKQGQILDRPISLKPIQTKARSKRPSGCAAALTKNSGKMTGSSQR